MVHRRNYEFILVLHQPRGWTYQFDGHIFVSIEVFSQPQLSKVPAADFFAHTEVWANHKNSRIGPWTPAPMSSPAACRLRHLFPFLCLSLAPSLVKIHKLMIPWPLHGYSPAMQTIETPITTTEEALGVRGETNLTGQREGVAVKMCNGSEDTWMSSDYNWSTPCVYQTALLLSASLFSSCSLFTRMTPFLCVSPAPVSE